MHFCFAVFYFTTTDDLSRVKPWFRLRKIKNLLYCKIVSNLFNNFFTEIGKSLAESLPRTSNDNDPTLLIANNLNSLYLQPVTITEVQDLIANLNTHKSVPSFCIPIKFIKLSTKVISPILAKIFNLCIEKGRFPEAFKLSEILPIYKAGSKTKVTNYRPIALLSAFSKLLEKMYL